MLKNSRRNLLAATCLAAPSTLLMTAAATAAVGDWAPGAAVTTCSAPNDGDPVIGIEDLRSPSTTNGVLGQAWNYGSVPGIGKPPMTKMWTRSELGQVFGIALSGDSTPDIFTSSTDIYPDRNPNGGVTSDCESGVNSPQCKYRIFRLRPGGLPNGGTYELFHQVASVGGDNAKASLGQIAYNKDASPWPVLYVSNLNDGVISIIQDRGPLPSTSNLLGTYDHGVAGRAAIPWTTIPDGPGSDITGFGRRVWAVQYNRVENRLYYAVNDSATQNTIWSVKLASDGKPDASGVKEEFKVASTSGNQISDIAFTFSGASMMVAERYHHRNPVTNVFSQVKGAIHTTRVLHYSGGSGAWTSAPGNPQKVGALSTHNNSAGGVDYSYDYNASRSAIDPSKPEGRVLATGDALTRATTLNYDVYGVQSTAVADLFAPFALTSHYFLDFNSVIGGPGNDHWYDKTMIGDVEAWREPYRKEGDGIIKICKVAGEGVELDTPFTFVDNKGNSVTIPAGPAPGGYCQVLGSNYVVGEEVVVHEPEGGVTDIRAAPSGNVKPDIAGGTATVRVIDGVTEVTFVDEGSCYIEVCKEGEVKGKFTFLVDTRKGQREYTVPAGACTPAIELRTCREVKVVEAQKQGFAMTGSRTLPADRWRAEDLKKQTVWVKMPPGDISKQTIIYVKNKATGGGGGGSQEKTKKDTPSASFFGSPVAAATSLGCAQDEGQSLCTARVVAASASAGSPGGMMSFVSDGRTIAVIPVKADGTAMLALPEGFNAQEIVARYLGDPAFQASYSEPFRFRKSIWPSSAPTANDRQTGPDEKAD